MLALTFYIKGDKFLHVLCIAKQQSEKAAMLNDT
jgi:hypothetical protein